MRCREYDAPSISVSSGREGPRPPGAPALPVIILNFQYETAQKLVQDVLQTLAKSEHVVAGYYLHDDGKMTLGCYLVLPVPQADGRPKMYLIGNERDMPENEWIPFRERMGEFGKFLVSCGIHTGDPNGTFLTKPEWFVEASEFHYNPIWPILSQRVGINFRQNG